MITIVEAHLWQAAFPTFGGSMGVLPLGPEEQYWYEEIKRNFMYPVAGAFANPPTATEGAHIPNPRPLRAMTSAGKGIVYLSSKESVGSSNGELSSWSNIFAGVLRDLGLDLEEKKKKPPKKKKVIIIDPEPINRKSGSSRAATGASEKGTLHIRQSNLEDYVTSDSLKGLSHIGEKKSSAAGSRSSGSVGSRNPDAGATPSSIALDDEDEEEEKEDEEEPVDQLVSRKRSTETAAVGVKVAQKTEGIPVIGKQSNLRTLYKFSPEAKKKTPEKGVVLKDPKEPMQKTPKKKAADKPVDKIVEKEKEIEKEQEKKKAAEKPEGDQPKETPTATTVAHEKAQGPEVVHMTGLDQPLHEKRKEHTRGKGPQIVKPTKPMQDASTAAGGAGAASGARGSMPQTIGPKDTVGDICYKTYTEETRGNAPHQAPWGLKQKDTFLEFDACRDWFLNSSPPGEVNHQRARSHDGLYQAYVVREANTHAANHQIVREWRTMVKERVEWKKYREHLVRQVKDFEKAKAAFAEEKAKFEADRKSEEWGREGLRGKLRAAEDLLAKERVEWKKICEKDNQRMYAARAKITDLEAQVTELKGKVEDGKTDRELLEVRC
ncbi:hypothetical protein Hanom_Chr00s000001g01597671 [Helianthus anomalus]